MVRRYTYFKKEGNWTYCHAIMSIARNICKGFTDMLTCPWSYQTHHAQPKCHSMDYVQYPQHMSSALGHLFPRYNTFKSEQNDRFFAGDTFARIFVKKLLYITVSLKLVLSARLTISEHSQVPCTHLRGTFLPSDLHSVDVILTFHLQHPLRTTVAMILMESCRQLYIYQTVSGFRNGIYYSTYHSRVNVISPDYLHTIWNDIYSRYLVVALYQFLSTVCFLTAVKLVNG